MLIRRMLCIAIVMICSPSVFSQGGWDLHYVPSNELDSSLVGKQVMIDFKTSSYDSVAGKIDGWDIRSLLSKRDTIDLTIGNELIRFAEDWKLYVDHGVLNEQGLVSIDRKKKETLRIEKMRLESISETSVVVISTINISGKKITERHVLNKSFIKGYVVREY